MTMDPKDKNQPYTQEKTEYATQYLPNYEDQESGFQQQIHDMSVGMHSGGPGYAAQSQEAQGLPNDNLEGQLRNMIMHHNALVPPGPQSPQMLEPMANTGNENMGNLPTSELTGHAMYPSHPHPQMPQPYPPHFLQGYAPMPPMFMHGPPPGMYPPHIPLHPYPIPFEGQLLPYPMPQPFPLGQYPPPGYVPMPPEQVQIGGFAVPADGSEGQGNNLPSAPRQFERSGPRHQRNHSYPKAHQKFPPRRQFDQGAPRANDHGYQSRQQQNAPQPPQPGLINDDFPPLGTERPKTKNTASPAASEQTYQQEGMNGARRGYMSGPPSGPRYRGGHRNSNPRNPQYHTAQERHQQQPYQPSPQELAMLNEVATEQIALATPSTEELEHKRRLRERLQKLCSNVSPTAELKAFGSLVSGFATVGSDLDLVLVDKGVNRGRPFFEIPLLLEQELKANGLEALLLAKTRVPILKIKQPATEDYPKEVAADIGFANSLAIRNTEMLSVYSKCDPRVIDMVRFVKRWAKQRKINNPYKGTLSSYGYVLMILHYLMNVVEPPVLPNLQLYPIPPETPKDEITTEEGHNVWYYKDVAEIERCVAKGTMTTNTMDLASLLLGFFEFYAYRFGWVKDIISIRTKGGMISKMDKGWVTAAMRVGKSETEYKDRYLFAIEDPFEINHNVSRTCNFYGVRKIRDEFRRANRIMRMREGEAALRVRLFEEAPEEVRPHQHRQSTGNEDHATGATEIDREEVEGNQFSGSVEEQRHSDEGSEHRNGNGLSPAENYSGLAAVVEGVQGLSVDA